MKNIFVAESACFTPLVLCQLTLLLEQTFTDKYDITYKLQLLIEQDIAVFVY
jgi:hypothetical protein